MSSAAARRPIRPSPPLRSGLRWIAPGLVAGAALLAVIVLSGGCGSLLTTAPDAGDVFDGPLEGLSPADLAAFAEGDEQFGKAFAMTEGLGPIFNNVSCASCHSGDGRGLPENVLTRFSVLGSTVPELGGPQLQERAIPGAEAERIPPNAETSRRLPPPVFGLGLIEAIPADSILARADPGDADGDGISGRAHIVSVPEFVPAHEPGGAPPALGPEIHLGRLDRVPGQKRPLLQKQRGLGDPPGLRVHGPLVEDLVVPIVRIDRHAAHADAIEGQLVQDVLGPVLQQSCHPMTKAIAGLLIDCRKLLDALAGLAIGDLKPRGQIVASVVCRHRQERLISKESTSTPIARPSVICVDSHSYKRHLKNHNPTPVIYEETVAGLLCR